MCDREKEEEREREREREREKERETFPKKKWSFQSPEKAIKANRNHVKLEVYKQARVFKSKLKSLHLTFAGLILQYYSIPVSQLSLSRTFH